MNISYLLLEYAEIFSLVPTSTEMQKYNYLEKLCEIESFLKNKTTFRELTIAIAIKLLF